MSAKPLQHYLGRAYAAAVRSSEPTATVVADFVADADEALMTAARAEAARVRNISPQRCFASAQARSFLEMAIKAKEAQP